MPRSSFHWSAFPESRLRGLCRDLGLDAAEPARTLSRTYGARPDARFVQEAWPFLRERLLAADALLRRRVVGGLVASRVGGQAAPIGRTAELDFLRARNNTGRLREIVLAALMDVAHNQPESQRRAKGAGRGAPGSAPRSAAVRKSNVITINLGDVELPTDAVDRIEAVARSALLRELAALDLPRPAVRAKRLREGNEPRMLIDGMLVDPAWRTADLDEHA